MTQHGHFIPAKGGLYVSVVADIVVIVIHRGVIHAVVYRDAALELCAAGALAPFRIAVINIVHIVALQITAIGLAQVGVLIAIGGDVKVGAGPASLCHAVVDELPQHGHFVPTKGG